jgi:hypothetical protein
MAKKKAVKKAKKAASKAQAKKTAVKTRATSKKAVPKKATQTRAVPKTRTTAGKRTRAKKELVTQEMGMLDVAIAALEASSHQNECVNEAMFTNWFMALPPERIVRVAEDLGWDATGYDVKTPEGRRELLYDLQSEFEEEDWKYWCDHYGLG